MGVALHAPLQVVGPSLQLLSTPRALPRKTDVHSNPASILYELLRDYTLLQRAYNGVLQFSLLSTGVHPQTASAGAAVKLIAY